ncbi:MAG: SIS domain-containing protein [Eubacteriales bacterium]|jgi:D-sedoheptulose 7-phosphate isomerase|nr:SIS domain-containing protein [Eubacteriales bacterium]
MHKMIQELIARFPALIPETSSIEAAFELLRKTYRGGGKVLCCGNGGSCADCDHIVGELMKSFKFKRNIDYITKGNLRLYGPEGVELINNLEGALPAVSLCGHNALTTALINDTNPKLTFAQQLYGLAKGGDVLIALTTSGNSENCILAAITAKAMALPVISFTGDDGGKIAEYSDVIIRAPEHETYKVQEYHLPIYHTLCAMLEEEFFGNQDNQIGPIGK